MRRDRVERRILVPGLLVYVVLLGLSSWRHEIRPAVFDRASRFARETLAVAGIHPAVAVFSADTAIAPDAKIAAICLEVRAVSKEGAATPIYPPEGVDCPSPAPRVWVRGEEIFLHRSLVSLRAAAAAHQGGDDDPRKMRFARLLAGSIRAHFQGREGSDSESSGRVMLLWREKRISYESHATTDRVVALLEWKSDVDPRVFIAWRPDEARLRDLGWVSGAP